MKHFTVSLIMLLTLSPGLASCSTDDLKLPLQMEQPTAPDTLGDDEEGNDNDTNNSMNDRLNIRIGDAAFRLTLENNAASTALKSLLPLTLNMADLNDNEKFFNLPTNLPTATSRPSTLQTGDLMLFGSNCLVLFYETFSSSYSYTRLGRIDNPMGLATALGSGSATILFEIAINKNKTQ